MERGISKVAKMLIFGNVVLTFRFQQNILSNHDTCVHMCAVEPICQSRSEYNWPKRTGFALRRADNGDHSSAGRAPAAPIAPIAQTSFPTATSKDAVCQKTQSNLLLSSFPLSHHFPSLFTSPLFFTSQLFFFATFSVLRSFDF